MTSTDAATTSSSTSSSSKVSIDFAKTFAESGSNNTGKTYGTLEEMWKDELIEEGDEKQWYQGGERYWEGVPPTVNGVLGGFGHISDTDIKGSETFIKSLIEGCGLQQGGVAVDCGAGIGRITKDLLLKYFSVVDLVEPNERFLQTAKETLKNPNGKYLCLGLQSFVPEEGRYDLIWVQWVALYLHDDDFIAFLNRCTKGLKPGGLVCIKENTSKGDFFIVDKEDNSITRSVKHYEELFRQSDMKIMKSTLQRGFPKGLFPVRCWALQPL